MPLKRITFIVIPPNDGQVREYRFSSRIMWAGGLLFIGFVCALGYYTSGYYTRVNEHQELAVLQQENTTLTMGLDRTTRELLSLELQMKDLHDDDTRLRYLNEMTPLTAEDRMVGMGGRDLPVEDYAILSARKRELLENLAGRVERLRVQARQQEESFHSIDKQVRALGVERRTLPTISPVSPDHTWKSSKFGRRNDPFTGVPSRHLGMDIAGRKGEPIWATADGIVKYAGPAKNRLGNTVVVNHNAEGVDENGEPYETPGWYRTEYGHLDEILVVKGQWVKRGQQIATMGSTGRSTGPHLHYAVRYQQRSRGGYRGYLNPQDFLLDWPQDDSVVEGYLARVD